MIERIPRHRWHELDFSLWGGEMPAHGTIYGWVEDGVVVGWYLVENAVHVGAFTVAPEQQGNGIASALAQHAYDTLDTGYYVAAMTPQTAAMCRKFNMTEVDGTLFVQV